MKHSDNIVSSKKSSTQFPPQTVIVLSGQEDPAHPAKIDLNEKWLPKEKNIQNFNIDAQGFRKTRNENPPTREIGVIS